MCIAIGCHSKGNEGVTTYCFYSFHWISLKVWIWRKYFPHCKVADHEVQLDKESKWKLGSKWIECFQHLSTSERLNALFSVSFSDWMLKDRQIRQNWSRDRQFSLNIKMFWRSMSGSVSPGHADRIDVSHLCTPHGILFAMSLIVFLRIYVAKRLSVSFSPFHWLCIFVRGLGWEFVSLQSLSWTQRSQTNQAARRAEDFHEFHFHNNAETRVLRVHDRGAAALWCVQCVGIHFPLQFDLLRIEQNMDAELLITIMNLSH